MVIKRCSKPFSQFFLFAKYDLIRLTPYHWQPCISQVRDIRKGMVLLNFSQTKKRDYQLVALISLTKSESFATGICRPRLPVLIYSVIILGFKFYIIHRLKTSKLA